MTSQQAQERLGKLSGHFKPRGLLENEPSIITGAGQGIGKACALLFAQEGSPVCVTDLDEKKAKDVVDEITKNGGKAIAVAGDVTAQDFPKRAVEATVKAFGTVNHLVLMAGFTFDKMLHNMSDETWNIIQKVHTEAPFRMIREAAPYFRSKDPERIKANKSIILVSSTTGLHGNAGQANYAVAKAGVTGLAKTVAKEFGAFNTRANTVAFGYIETRLTQAKEIGEYIEVNGQKIALGIPGAGKNKQTSADRIPDIPLGRPGQPIEGAKACLFLASPLSSYISGHTLEVTGGRGI